MMPHTAADRFTIMMLRRSNYFVAIAVVSLEAAAIGKVPPIPQGFNYLSNPGFERSDPKQAALPDAWDVDVANKTDTLEIVKRDQSVHHCGRAAARIRFIEAMNYSGVIQRLSALDMAGKDAQFSAYVRRSSATSVVGIWLLVADINGNKLTYINSYEQPVRAGSNWTRHVLSLHVSKEAFIVKVGAAIYEKDGTMWVDDMHLALKDVSPVTTSSCTLKDDK